MMTLCWRKSDGTLTTWWGTKNDRIMNRPMTAVMNSGTSRFIPASLLSGHPLGEPVEAEGLEPGAHDDHHDDHDLDQIRALQASHQSRLAGKIGAGGVELLADQGVIAGHHEERKLVHIGGTL